GDNGSALGLGIVGNLRPIVVLESGTADPDAAPSSPKIGRTITIQGRKKVVLRWVHAGLENADASLALAQRWLGQDWTAAFPQIPQAAQAIPSIETGNLDWDTTIAFAYQQLMQAFIKPTASLPHASFVAVRQPERGFYPQTNTNEHDRAWNGQSPILA